MNISLAPLQGFTEYPFRNAMAIIGGIDKFYTPFIKFENDGSIKSKHINDLLPENNEVINLIPQILVNNSKHFLQLAQIIEEYGYTELNWNLGCPYPMVAKRKLGSGLLAFPELIDEILNEVIPKTKLSISVKFRSGYSDDSEIDASIKTLNNFPLTELIYHPRIGKQLYKGRADLDKFTSINSKCNLPLAYNGDIDSTNKIYLLQNKFPNIHHIMIGRALISNPFLAYEFKTGKRLSDNDKREQFSTFHGILLEHYTVALSGDSHLLNKFIHYWEYFSQIFVDNRKVYKKVKKCKKVSTFISTVDDIIENATIKQTETDYE